MKSKVLLVISAILLFGVGIAVYAFNSNQTTTAATHSCCTGDSCPLKSANAKATGDTTSCCDNCDCCSGDSCPMKGMGQAHAGGMKMADAESCPLMKSGEAAKASYVQVKDEAKSGDGKSCSCSCCSHDNAKKETQAL